MLGGGLEVCDGIAERQADVVAREFAFEQGGHRCVELRKDLLLEFDQMHRQPLALQLLAHFQTDETGTDDHGTHSGFTGGDDAIHVLQAAQREDALVADARNGRTQR